MHQRVVACNLLLRVSWRRIVGKNESAISQPFISAMKGASLFTGSIEKHQRTRTGQRAINRLSFSSEFYLAERGRRKRQIGKTEPMQKQYQRN